MPTLASEALRVAEQAGNIVLQWAGADAGLAAVRIGARTIPTTPAGEVWLHYTPPVAARYVPAWKVLDEGDAATRADLAGKIVLVGSSAQALRDLRFGPFGPFGPLSGV